MTGYSIWSIEYLLLLNGSWFIKAVVLEPPPPFPHQKIPGFTLAQELSVYNLWALKLLKKILFINSPWNVDSDKKDPLGLRKR